MSREVVRNIRVHKTHYADVTSSTAATMFGAAYAQPHPETRALCGVHIHDGVVMRNGTTVRCGPCRYLHEKESRE